MKAQLGEQGVPFVITYRKVLKRPKLARRRKFVGVFQMMRNALSRAIETVEDLAFETETEVIDPGQSVAVHWALDIEDPWDTTTGREKNLVAYRMLGDKPPSGAHFEIFSMPSAPPSSEGGSEDQASGPSAQEQEQEQEQPSEISPERWSEAIRAHRITEVANQGNGNRVRNLSQVEALTRPVVDSAYARRPVRTLDEEVTEESGEEPNDLDRSGRVGEDD